MKDWCVNIETVRLQDSLTPVVGDELVMITLCGSGLCELCGSEGVG